MCPFIDEADVRCTARLTLRELARAFSECADGYTKCPIYQEMIAHEPHRQRQESRRRLAVAS